MKKILIPLMATVLISMAGCNKPAQFDEAGMQKRVDAYAEFSLSSDLIANLSEDEKQLIPIFIEISKIMDDLYWEQAFGVEQRKSLDTLTSPAMRAFANIHYGAWDRLNGDTAFIPGYLSRPVGANFYPADMEKYEFVRELRDSNKRSPYTVIRRDEDGALKAVFYHEAYAEKLAQVDTLLAQAIEIAQNPGLKNYLIERRKAFQTDDYFASDMAWMDMKDSRVDFVVGPIENYDDKLFGYKTSYEAFILLKDEKWSNDLAKFAAMLPELQTLLPCDEKYKQERPGTESDLNVYDAVYYAGDCNASSKTIAINLPNDERVHLQKGSRRLQLKNVMNAKFEKIMVPIAKQVICPKQQKNVNFEAFFSNVCFHEVAHGLGIKNTITGKGTLREALNEQYSAWEEAKADICGLFLTETLIEKGEITNCTVEDAYVTFIAGIFRSVRFGASEDHGIANMLCFNFLQEKGAFTRNAKGQYSVDIEKAKAALREWVAFIMQIEGEGDYDLAKSYAEAHGKILPELQQDLDRINNANIPLDIRFKQGTDVLGLQ